MMADGCTSTKTAWRSTHSKDCHPCVEDSFGSALEERVAECGSLCFSTAFRPGSQQWNRVEHNRQAGKLLMMQDCSFPNHWKCFQLTCKAWPAIRLGSKMLGLRAQTPTRNAFCGARKPQATAGLNTGSSARYDGSPKAPQMFRGNLYMMSLLWVSLAFFKV